MDNTINSLVSQAVGVTDQQVKDALAANPGMSDQQIAQAMQTYGVSPAQLARVVGVSEGEVAARVAATIPPGQTMLLGDTYVQPQYQTTGSGMDQQTGGIENVLTYKANENQVGGGYNQYNPDGTLQRQGTQQKVDNSMLPFLLAAGGMAFGLPGLGEAGGSTLGSLGVVGSDLAGLSGIPAGAGALTAAEAAALYGTAGAAALPTAGVIGSDLAGLSGIPAGTGALTAAEAAALYGTGGASLGTIAGMGAGTGITAAGAGSALGTSLATGLGLSALGTGLGGLANQAGITDARNLINQYGTQAGTNLATAYQNAQGLNAANRTDLGNIYKNTSGNLYDLYSQQVGYQNPYQDIGRAGSTGLLANQDYLTRQFTNADLNANLAPNYAFQLGQGQMANQRAANMGGGALSGNALQGLQRYTQDYAGGAYQNAFNNFNTQRQNIYGNLSGMANIGTTSAGQLANLGSNYGSNMGSLASNFGGNLTTGYGQGIGAANAYGLNTANLATGIGGALASNATQTGANNATMLSNLGNTALLGSMLKAT